MLRPRRYPVLFRLERIDRELNDAARMLAMMADDMLGTMGAGSEAQERLTIVIAIIGAMLLILETDRQLVAAWLMAMQPGEDLEEADALGRQILDEVMLRHTGAAGEG